MVCGHTAAVLLDVASRTCSILLAAFLCSGYYFSIDNGYKNDIRNNSLTVYHLVLVMDIKMIEEITV